MVFSRQYSKRSMTVAAPAVRREVPASVRCPIQGRDVLGVQVGSRAALFSLP